MDEPPAKRARRTDSAAMGDGRGRSARDTESPVPRSPRRSEHETRPRGTQGDSRNGEYAAVKSEDTRRRRSRSPREERGRHGHERRRSRSPRGGDRTYRDRDAGRHRERSRSRDRYRDRDLDHETSRSTRGHRKNDRKRSRSRSPHRNGTKSITASTGTNHPKAQSADCKLDSKPSIPTGPSRSAKREEDDVEMDVDGDNVDAILKKMMGFSSFKSTQNTKVPGNQIYGVRKEKKSEYRQYMNRVGGFNRPLSPGR